ncbi:MAG: hypothetical protein N2C14_14415, partial [Planctomycetales bacterium]
IQYYDWVPLVMEETILSLDVRVPSQEETDLARKYLRENLKTPKPQTLEEVYARETVLLAEGPPKRALKLQAIRLGALGIAAIPNETYSSTGLTIKKESPLKTFTIELANGCEGYIPPPEQHKLGGYTTWRARTSCLEEQAEPKIRETILKLLRQVAGARAAEKPIPSK